MSDARVLSEDARSAFGSRNCATRTFRLEELERRTKPARPPLGLGARWDSLRRGPFSEGRSTPTDGGSHTARLLPSLFSSGSNVVERGTGSPAPRLAMHDP